MVTFSYSLALRLCYMNPDIIGGAVLSMSVSEPSSGVLFLLGLVIVFSMILIFQWIGLWNKK